MVMRILLIKNLLIYYKMNGDNTKEGKLYFNPEQTPNATIQ